MTYNQKILEVKKCNLGFIEEATRLGIDIMCGKREEEYTEGHKLSINNLFYRYRNQIYKGNQYEKLRALPRDAFLLEVWRMSKGIDTDITEAKSVKDKIHYSRQDIVKLRNTSMIPLKFN